MLIIPAHVASMAVQGHESVAGLVEHIRLCAQHQQHLSSSSTSLPAPLRQLHAALHAALPTSELAEGDAAQTAAALIAALDQVTSQVVHVVNACMCSDRLYLSIKPLAHCMTAQTLVHVAVGMSTSLAQWRAGN